MKRDVTRTLHEHPIAFLRPGTKLNGRYVIEKVLGSGGMGRVYLAIDDVMPGGRRCAVKETTMPAETPPTPEQERYIRALRIEAEIMSRLTHPAIPRVIDFFETGRRYYLVMDHVEGKSLLALLSEHLERTGTCFDEYAVTCWMMQICQLFIYLHHQNPPVIHRDVKPEHFLLAPNGELRMIDYGIARRVAEDMQVTQQGTPGYVAPETYDGFAEPRTDIYSLGVTMHVLLTNLNPCTIADSYRSIPWEEHRPRIYRPELSSEIDAIIMRCLQFDIPDRWPSAHHLYDALLIHRRRLDTTRPPGGVITSTTFNAHVLPPSPLPPDYKTAMAPKVAWVYKAGGGIRSSVAIRDGVAYFGAHDAHVYALSVTNGELIGAFVAGGNIFTDPLVTDRSIYFGGDDGVFYAVNRALTRRQWSYSTGHPIVSSPARLGDMVVAGVTNGNVLAFPLAGVEPCWTFESWAAVNGPITTTPDLALFGSDDQRIYALDAQGRRKWWRTTRDRVEAMPVVARNLALVGGMDGMLYALDLELGTQVWKKRLERSIVTGVAVVDRYVYVPSAEGRITCLDLRTGEMGWRYNESSQITTDLVACQQHLYYGCADGSVCCLDLASHELRWRHVTNGPVFTRPALAPGLVLVGSVDHHLYALEDADVHP